MSARSRGRRRGAQSRLAGVGAVGRIGHRQVRREMAASDSVAVRSAGVVVAVAMADLFLRSDPRSPLSSPRPRSSGPLSASWSLADVYTRSTVVTAEEGAVVREEVVERTVASEVGPPFAVDPSLACHRDWPPF